MIDRLDHVMVLVDGLDRASARTAALLGREPSWRGQHPGYGTANALFRLDNTYLELIAPASDEGFGAVLRAALDEGRQGVFGLAFGSGDVAETVLELRERGVEIADPQPGSGRDEESGVERRWRNAFLTPEASRGLLVFVIQHDSPPERLPLVAPSESPASAVHALDHVVVTSRDVEGTRAFYGDRLGLRLALDRTFEERGVRLLFFRVGGTTVEVGGSAKEAPDPQAPDRFGGLAWKVEDADAARARLHAAGFDVSEVRPGHKPGTRVCTVRDAPGAVPTLIIEPAAPVR
jgi:catechol 2,3-dioxygenase-like lactoylglutathione lyase family enzyme